MWAGRQQASDAVHTSMHFLLCTCAVGNVTEWLRCERSIQNYQRSKQKTWGRRLSCWKIGEVPFLDCLQCDWLAGWFCWSVGEWLPVAGCWGWQERAVFAHVRRSHKSNCKKFSMEPTYFLIVYILHTLYSVTTCSIINTERTAVQHSVCVSEIFSWHEFKRLSVKRLSVSPWLLMPIIIGVAGHCCD